MNEVQKHIAETTKNSRKRTFPKLFLAAFTLFVCCIVFSSIALAITIEKSISKPELEDRAQDLFREIKCLVCEGQAIHDSDSEFARSMRSIIREQIEQGRSDKEVLSYVEDKYGDDILLKPQFKEETILIWVAPFLIVAFGMLFLLRLIKRQETQI